jgi:hypothetical protein
MATRRRICRIRVLAKRAIFGNMQDSPDSPPFAKPFTEDSPDSPTFAKPFTEYSPTFAKPFTEDSPDSLKVSLASITRVWRNVQNKTNTFRSKLCENVNFKMFTTWLQIVTKSLFVVKTTFHEKLKYKNVHHTITIVNIHRCLDILTKGSVWRYQDSS